ncbi:MAG: hypothetical protein ABIU29_11245 [Chthoniobacterales bacterium]
MHWAGVNFGATNSVVAFVAAAAAAVPVLARSLRAPTAPRPTIPSVLYFEPKKPSVAGAAAIERYLTSETVGR